MTAKLATHVPRLWPAATVAILAGGPSLSAEQAVRVRAAQLAGRCRVIAINRSVEIAPWADLLWFCDEQFYLQHRAAVEAFAGLRATLENYALRDRLPGLWCLHNLGSGAGPEGPFFGESYGLCNGRNSGYQALCLTAWLTGRGGTALLLGYDMKPGPRGESHWHGGYRHRATPANTWRDVMLPGFAPLAPVLAARGLRVINVTPGSAIDCFERGELADVLGSGGDQPDQGAAALSA